MQSFESSCHKASVRAERRWPLMADQSENRITSWVSDDLKKEVDDHVNWRYDSRSHWVREALKYRIALEDALERRDIELPEDDEEREAMIEDIATAGVATFATDADE